MVNKLKNLIEKSKLTKKQKEVWRTLFLVLPKKGKEEILEALEENPKHLRFLTENLLGKFEGFAKGDKKVLDKVLKKEENYLKNL